MRLPVRFVFAAAAVLLSSCWWVGPPFYKGDPADAGPLKPGLYETETSGALDQLGKGTTQSRMVVRVVWRRDGSVRWSDPRKPGDRMTFVAARLAIAGRDMWVIQNDFDKRHRGDADLRAYGLMEARGDTVWLLPALDCDETADIVRAAGGTVSGGMVETAASNVADADMIGNEIATDEPPEDDKRVMQTCAFADRASLERALRAYVAAHPDFPEHIRFKRIDD
ncbi:MAG: hypothetical protein ACTHJR_19195 [Sphingomonas sp.]|uniref:hypothetical protein n=1 Tax=Sphingomonas sp. TaxID=28214 RepID=UPI003F7EB81A